MRLKPTTLTLLAGAVFTVLSTSSPARAGTIGGAFPGANAANAVSYSFMDTLQGATLTISGKINIDDEMIAPLALATPDGFWTGAANVSLDETQDDELNIITNLQHIISPPDAPMHDDAASYTGGGTILAENFDDTQVALHTVAFAGMSTIALHPPHEDVIVQDSISFTKTTEEFPTLDQDEITNFTYTLQVTHVPEPETYALMLAGLGLIGFMAQRKKAEKTASSRFDAV